MRTYKRLGCTIKIEDTAEEILKYLNINIDKILMLERKYRLVKKRRRVSRWVINSLKKS